MRIAIPVEDGRLAQHFGHARQFALADVDADSRTVLSITEHPAPPHEPGRLPAWLREQGAEVVITGGMGPRAVALLEASSIEVIPGAPSLDPRSLVAQYLEGVLAEGPNRCDHGDHGGHDGRGGRCGH